MGAPSNSVEGQDDLLCGNARRIEKREAQGAIDEIAWAPHRGITIFQADWAVAVPTLRAQRDFIKTLRSDIAAGHANSRTIRVSLEC